MQTVLPHYIPSMVSPDSNLRYNLITGKIVVDYPEFVFFSVMNLRCHDLYQKGVLHISCFVPGIAPLPTPVELGHLSNLQKGLKDC